jgi:hypothetical protein
MQSKHLKYVFCFRFAVFFGTKLAVTLLLRFLLMLSCAVIIFFAWVDQRRHPQKLYGMLMEVSEKPKQRGCTVLSVQGHCMIYKF